MSQPAAPDVSLGRLDDLERRIAVLEDQRAIETLKYRYAALMDSGYDAEGLAALFLPEGRWRATGFGDFVGREQIRAFFAAMPRQVSQAQHHVSAPRIELAPDGGTATGEFYLFCVSRTQHAEASRPERFATLARYVDRFVKLDGRWYFEDLQADVSTVFRLQTAAPVDPAGTAPHAVPR